MAGLDAETNAVFWHRELPPLDVELLGEHIVEASSTRVKGDLAHRNALWDECYDDLMARAHDRLVQEVARLGGHYAHVLEEFVASRRNDVSGESWLQGRFFYVLLRRLS
jgi:hypothetical protein